MPMTTSAVELFISERAAAISVCHVNDMKAKIPESAHWLSNFGLSVIFNDFPPTAMRPFVINFIRRIYAAFIEYDLGRQSMLELVKDGHGRWSPYFAALTHFELAVIQLSIALESINKIANHKFYEKGDGSFEECLNKFYNTCKHQPATDEVPTWLTNEGLECANAKLSFEELEEFMVTMAGVVKGLSNAETAKEFLTK